MNPREFNYSVTFPEMKYNIQNQLADLLKLQADLSKQSTTLKYDIGDLVKVMGGMGFASGKCGIIVKKLTLIYLVNILGENYDIPVREYQIAKIG